jgi:hypothetical protein
MNGKVKETILLSKLPLDVGEKEVLCSASDAKTMEPLKFAFLIYNSQGKSQGLLLLFNGLEMRRLRGRSTYDGMEVTLLFLFSRHVQCSRGRFFLTVDGVDSFTVTGKTPQIEILYHYMMEDLRVTWSLGNHLCLTWWVK